VHKSPGIDAAGILTRRQRRWAWLGFLATATNAPVAARLLDDASWLFCACVSALVAAVIVIDDQTRRMAAARRRDE
jgi:hypothetical protein